MATKLNKTAMALVPRNGLRANLELLTTFHSSENYEILYTTDGKQLFIMGTDFIRAVQTLDMALVDEDGNVLTDEDFTISYEF